MALGSKSGAVQAGLRIRAHRYDAACAISTYSRPLSIRDRADGAPLWKAHFHYDQLHTQPLNFSIRGGYLKTLEQSRRGIEVQRRDELAGLPHAAIWRQTLDGRTATRIFALASPAAEPN